ncbi:hypothetical protein BKA65DRAFT_48965 [Rhexocercosporidium sp. MPI-PUGE-AT-0058]|nr:hypothetical protein BKA65DRAFT_48965 [Rhexocercosporidium sp. MPI-PUGE-AT-0058]
MLWLVSWWLCLVVSNTLLFYLGEGGLVCFILCNSSFQVYLFLDLFIFLLFIHSLYFTLRRYNSLFRHVISSEVCAYLSTISVCWRYSSCRYYPSFPAASTGQPRTTTKRRQRRCLLFYRG